MKRKSLLLFFLFFFVALQAENRDSLLTASDLNRYEANSHQVKPYEQTAYWKKHKKLKRCAFTTLGLGIGGIAVGWFGTLSNTAYTNSNWENEGKVWDIVFFTGIGLTVSSIPLFVFSHKNKRKAKQSVQLSLSSSPVYVSLPNGARQAQSTVGLCIRF